MRIVFDITDQEAQCLEDMADRPGVGPEELARAALSEFVRPLGEDFEKTARRMIEKNRELYQRLS